MKNLNNIQPGSKAVIVFIQGGRGACHRLAELGLLPGEKVTMFNNSGAGPVTVCVKGSKLSIGHGLAQKIIVREE
ncbi:FeoA domain-containing protein [bacterium]|nr:FeoA domain-containing protein [bacterium]